MLAINKSKMSVQRFNKNHSDTQPYHIYYDMNLINNDSSFPAQPVRFQYKETRSQPYLLSPQDYFMSIVRFNLQTPTLPIFIPQINLNTNTNFGGTYPLTKMGAEVVANAPFEVTLYTSIPFPVGTVVYLANNNLTPTTNDASATAQQYYRVTAVNTYQSGQTTVLTLLNTTATGNPSLYPGSASFLRGGTQTVSFAKLPVGNVSYNSGTGQITITYAGTGGLGTLADLTSVYKVGDTIYINNSGQYNAKYTIASLTANTIVCNAPLLANLTVAPYAGGGYFLPIGDYYNVTPYTMTMKYTPAGQSAVTFTQPITYTPNDLTQPIPQWNPANPQALNLQDITAQYYWVYNYEAWINQVNQAMTNCFWGLSGQNYATYAGALPMTGSTPTNYTPPSMSWNSSTDIAIITADNNAFSQSTGVLAKYIVYLYFNQPLSTLFDSFPCQYNNVTPDSPFYSSLIFNPAVGAGYFIVQDWTVFPPSTTNGYLGIQIYQDHQTASLMNPIQSIVFTSTLLPVVMENVGLPLILNGTAPTQQVVGSSANIFPVVTDFVVPFTATNQYVPDITYTPSGEYRLVDLYGESPASQIDIQVFWKDIYGILHPFLVGSGCSGSLKVMFRRKNYNNVYEASE